MNTRTHVTNERVKRAKRWRFNPLRHLEPETLSRHLDSFEAGYLREAVNIWEHIEQRDDLLRAVISKRKKSVGRSGWTVLPVPDLKPGQAEEAAAHAGALEFFYSNLECEHAIDENERGGFKLLARQMMDAVGKRFAVHEVVWRVVENQRLLTSSPTRRLTARFRFVPLSFFENTTGRLRFLENEASVEGRDLEQGGWMVTVGEGLMVASSTAWMFKNISLNDWLLFSQRNGTPGLRGISAAVRDSDEWKALESSLDDLLGGNPVVHGTSDDIKVVDLGGNTAIPYPPLVERVDRLMATLWRGADLSTLSRDRGYGASLQEKETCALEEDDAEMLTETLNRYVDDWVIRYLFGQSARPLARVKVLASQKECTSYDLQVDEFLLKHGAPLAVVETLNRYGRALPRKGEAVLGAGEAAKSVVSGPLSVEGAAAGAMGGMTAGNERLAQQGRPLTPALSPGRGEGEAASAFGNGVVAEEAVARLQNQSLLTSTPTGDVMGNEESELVAGQKRCRASLATALQNEAAAGTTMELGNAFEILQPEWVQISPYGDFPHSRGLQRVDRGAAETMVQNFNSFLGKLGRLFGGAPFYVGHPDMPETSDAVDRKAYGWVSQLEAREDGLYARVKWSEPGLELLRNAHYKFLSPYWEAEEIGRDERGVIYRPVVLLSAGLTNQPNLPVKPLANEEERRRRREESQLLSESIDSENAVNTQAGMNEATLCGEWVSNGEETSQRLVTSSPTNGKEIASALENAFAGGRITPAQEEFWRYRLQNDFANASADLGRLAPVMHTRSCTEGLGLRKGETQRLQNRRDRIQELVRGKMRLGMSYDEAWESVKRERAEWFEQMAKPE